MYPREFGKLGAQSRVPIRHRARIHTLQKFLKETPETGENMRALHIRFEPPTPRGVRQSTVIFRDWVYGTLCGAVTSLPASRKLSLLVLPNCQDSSHGISLDSFFHTIRLLNGAFYPQVYIFCVFSMHLFPNKSHVCNVPRNCMSLKLI